MQKAKLFPNGQSQAVRLPKACRFDGDEVIVKARDQVVTTKTDANLVSGYVL